MKKKQKIDLSIAILLILIGIILTILPKFNLINIRIILFIVMMVYATLNMVQYVLTVESNDMEGLYTSILSYVVGILGLVFNLFDNLLQMVLLLFAWIILMSLIKLKKCDYYNDRHNKMWILKLITLSLFILTGVLTCINLYYTNDIQLIILGFFFYIHGILEMIDPIVIYLMENKNENSK